MGMDSIMTVQLRHCLETSLVCSLPPTLAFEYPTIEALTRYLGQEVLGLDVPDRPAHGATSADQGVQASARSTRFQNRHWSPSWMMSWQRSLS